MPHDRIVLRRSDSERVARFSEDWAGVDAEARNHFRYLAEQFAALVERRTILQRGLIETYGLDPGCRWDFEYDQYEGAYILVNKGPQHDQSNMAGPIHPGPQGDADGRDGQREDDGDKNVD